MEGPGGTAQRMGGRMMGGKAIDGLHYRCKAGLIRRWPWDVRSSFEMGVSNWIVVMWVSLYLATYMYYLRVYHPAHPSILSPVSPRTHLPHQLLIPSGRTPKQSEERTSRDKHNHSRGHSYGHVMGQEVNNRT
jgi:hypothetical protein